MAMRPKPAGRRRRLAKASRAEQRRAKPKGRIGWRRVERRRSKPKGRSSAAAGGEVAIRRRSRSPQQRRVSFSHVVVAAAAATWPVTDRHYREDWDDVQWVAVRVVQAAAAAELLARQQGDAVSSLVYEANDRMRDPVYGCVGAISFMQNQVSQLQMQLAVAQGEILCIQMQHRDGNENKKNVREEEEREDGKKERRC
uniref:LOB domain-containing protein n=1 Tax=Oryza rufipogon TaxID=4529 RepID=A0A0E0NK14_ORYRU